MREKISLAKASRMLNVGRSELQHLIKTGQLDTFEGDVDVEQLRKLFPTLNVELDSVMRDLEFIRKAAFSNRVQSRLLPNRGNIKSNLEKTRMQLLVEKQKSASYSRIMEELLQHMIALRVSADDGEKKIIDELSEWLTEKLDLVE